MKIDYKLPKPKGMTRKGTRPNTRGEKLLTVKSAYNGAVSRVSESRAHEMVKSGGYTYCPKSEYKRK